MLKTIEVSQVCRMFIAENADMSLLFQAPQKIYVGINVFLGNFLLVKGTNHFTVLRLGERSDTLLAYSVKTAGKNHWLAS